MMVSHNTKNIIQGVSNQSSDTRLESQVEIMDNCIIDINKGIFRRNKSIPVTGSIYQTSFNNNDDYYSFLYDVGNDENSYYIIINKIGKVFIFDLINDEFLQELEKNDYISSENPKEDLSHLIIGDKILIINKKKKVLHKYFQNGAPANVSLKENGIYYISKTTESIILQDSNGKKNTEGVTYTLNKLEFKAQRIQIKNDSVITDTNVLELEGHGFNYFNDSSIYPYTFTKSFVISKNNDDEFMIENPIVNSISETNELLEKDYRLSFKYNSIKYYLLSKEPFSITKSYDIIEVMKLLLNKLDDKLRYYSSENIIYFSKRYGGDIEDFDWGYSDSLINTASFAFVDIVNDVSKLPSIIKDNKIVKITNYSDDNNYYLNYHANKKIWVEWFLQEENTIRTFDNTTFPIFLSRDINNNFSFEVIETSEDIVKKVGDNETNSPPSFINSTINKAIFYKNRLGFITDDNLILSEQGNYFNFWRTNTIEVIATDRIDLTIISSKLNNLQSIIEINGNLVLFSKYNQFLIFDNDGSGIITPDNVNATILSKNEISNKCNVESYGKDIYYVKESGDHPDLYKYITNNGNKIYSEVIKLSSHIQNYLPKNIDMIRGKDGYIILKSNEEPNNLYIYNETIINNNIVQNAFHRWTFNYKISNFDFYNNKLLIVLKDNDEERSSMSLQYIDLEPDYELNKEYDDDGESLIEFSTIYMKDNKNYGSKRGKLQLKNLIYSIGNDKSKYKTIIKNKVYNNTERIYENTERVPIYGNNEQLKIIFKSFEDKGFNLLHFDFEANYITRNRRI